MKFDSYHPMINLIYFVATIGCVLVFRHPILVAIGYLSTFAYSIKLNGVRGLIFNVCLIPFIVAFAWYYSFYHHFGVTNLKENFVGNMITLESIVYGFVLGVVIATALMMGACLLAVVSSDKVVYLFGKISPKLSLFLSIILRSVPRIKKTASKINIARDGIGMGAGQGNIIKRLANVCRLISIVISWTMESFVMSSESMKNRGYSLKDRTAFSIYRFDNRDRLFVISIVMCWTVILAGVALNQATMLYNPVIIMNPITTLSILLYLAYAVLLLLPMMLQIAGEIRFKKCIAQRAAMTKHQDNATILFKV